jgi:HPt (histidine-containing phosphotransfer) domain-containing protein
MPVWSGGARPRKPKPPDPAEDDLELTDPGDEIGAQRSAGAANPPRMELEATEAGDDLVLEKAPERGLAGQSDPLILDVKRLDDTSMGIASLRQQLLSTFVTDLSPRINRMYEAFINHAGNRLEHEAHGLRGMAATIGAVACTAVFAEIERMAHEERWDNVEELIDQARAVAREFEEHVLTLKVRLDRAA